MGQFLTLSGFVALGLWSKGRYQLHTRSSSPVLQLPPYGLLGGYLGGLSCCATMSQWWLFLCLALRGTNT